MYRDSQLSRELNRLENRIVWGEAYVAERICGGSTGLKATARTPGADPTGSV